MAASPNFATYVAEFLRDYARHWKPATERSSRGLINRDLIPAFGELQVDAIIKADVSRWRDSFGEHREGVFNRAIPVLSVMLKYAEQLGYRKRGSNPCRGIPRFKRQLPERYLTSAGIGGLAAFSPRMNLHTRLTSRRSGCCSTPAHGLARSLVCNGTGCSRVG